jgi:prepilin-type N-terminal cleavage/methylation domain-containing protein
MLDTQAVKTIKTGRGNKGFTLIELLIAMAIFSVGILAVGAMQITATNSNALARMHTESYTWAVDRIEGLMALGYEDGDITAGDHGPVTEGPYAISWNVQDDTPTAGAKTIQVTVAGANRRARPLSIDFIKAR